jgi:hypothetical protein
MTHDSLSITEDSFSSTGSTEDVEAGTTHHLVECKVSRIAFCDRATIAGISAGPWWASHTCQVITVLIVVFVLCIGGVSVNPG